MEDSEPPARADKPNMHFVCTRAEARALVDRAAEYWVGECGCRSERGPCRRSRADVCLEFAAATAAEGRGRRRVTRDDVDTILREAEDKHLVTRPFRDDATRTKVEGICFCCDCCCGYFQGGYECDRGLLIEQTDADACTDCGACADVCYFGARRMAGDRLTVEREKCFGCGLCVDVCPVDCIRMAERHPAGPV